MCCSCSMMMMLIPQYHWMVALMYADTNNHILIAKVLAVWPIGIVANWLFSLWVADWPTLYFVYVCRWIKIQNPNQLSWAINCYLWGAFADIKVQLAESFFLSESVFLGSCLASFEIQSIHRLSTCEITHWIHRHIRHSQHVLQKEPFKVSFLFSEAALNIGKVTGWSLGQPYMPPFNRLLQSRSSCWQHLYKILYDSLCKSLSAADNSSEFWERLRMAKRWLG